ncbi:MAG: helix-turn-helix domain-containing protein [Lentimonas sp.]
MRGDVGKACLKDTGIDCIRLVLIPPTGIAARESTDALAVRDSIIRDVVEYLRENFRKSIGTKSLADCFKVSRRHLGTLFREPSLLNFSQEPIETIAALTGFCHALHFSSSFKKHFGLSPTSFRKQV